MTAAVNDLICQHISLFLWGNSRCMLNLAFANVRHGYGFPALKTDLGRAFVLNLETFCIDIYATVNPPETGSFEMDIEKIRKCFNKHLRYFRSEADCICTGYHPSTHQLVVTAIIRNDF